MTPKRREMLCKLAAEMRQAEREQARLNAEAVRIAGGELRARREAKRMTLRALAEALGVSAPFLSDVEHGRRRLSVELAKKADEVLK